MQAKSVMVPMHGDTWSWEWEHFGAVRLLCTSTCWLHPKRGAGWGRLQDACEAFFPTMSGWERQHSPAMSGAAGASRHRRGAALAAQRPRRRMLSPGNPRSCHIHQHPHRMQRGADRLLQHPSANRLQPGPPGFDEC